MCGEESYNSSVCDAGSITGHSSVVYMQRIEEAERDLQTCLN